MTTPVGEVRGNLIQAIHSDPGLISQIANALLERVPPSERAQPLSPELEIRRYEVYRFWRSLGVYRADARSVSYAEMKYRRHLASKLGDDFLRFGVIRLRGYDDGRIEIVLLQAAPKR
ncbi:MAG: hypothetical protein H6872_09290 [Methylobacteriaceae bacterium]|nr:hypothetical protein [Rhodoblastus sp.]MCC0005319.1 hypothetical protein [Methylobacteriaceae bacterium]